MMKSRIYKILFKPKYWNLMCQIMMRSLYYNAELCTYGVIGVIKYQEVQVAKVEDINKFDSNEIDLKNKILDNIHKAVEEAVIEELTEELVEKGHSITLPLGIVKRTRRWSWKHTK